MTDRISEEKKPFVLNKRLGRDILQYSIATLMYAPAVNGNIADGILNNKFNGLKALALCLEDAVGDEGVLEAEKQLLISVSKIYDMIQTSSVNMDNLPMLFVRVRSPLQMEMLYEKMGGYVNILTGFIAPKFDMANADDYKRAICRINRNSANVVYIMPIIESISVINIESRIESLLEIKKVVDSIKPYILNIRVGGNDFCNRYGLRRKSNQTIYDIEVVKNTLVDILNIFARDYVVSGPVWEYFDNNTSDEWRIGLQKELELDKLNGFIGKTAIHPSQLPVILDSMKVSENDYYDAIDITNWDNGLMGVSKSSSGQRMNELKTHMTWAEKVLILASIYGVNNIDN